MPRTVDAGRGKIGEGVKYINPLNSPISTHT
jgi:hypothetical protein